MINRYIIYINIYNLIIYTYCTVYGWSIMRSPQNHPALSVLLCFAWSSERDSGPLGCWLWSQTSSKKCCSNMQQHLHKLIVFNCHVLPRANLLSWAPIVACHACETCKEKKLCDCHVCQGDGRCTNHLPTLHCIHGRLSDLRLAVKETSFGFIWCPARSGQWPRQSTSVDVKSTTASCDIWYVLNCFELPIPTTLHNFLTVSGNFKDELHHLRQCFAEGKWGNILGPRRTINHNGWCQELDMSMWETKQEDGEDP